jgi:hypothetical protein
LVDASSNFPILDCAFPKTETKKQSPLYWESRRLEGDCLRVGDEIRFSELEVRQSDVHKIWFFSDSDAASRESDSIQGRKDPNKKKPKQAYDEWISGHEGKKPPSRDDDLMHMRELYPKIRRKTVRDFRTANKTASLHSLGRRPSVTTQAKINPAANLTK